MPRTFKLASPLAAAVCAALCLQGCGSSGGPAGKTSANSHSATTASQSRSPTVRTATSSTQTTNSAAAKAAEARRQVARAAAVDSISQCLRTHGVRVPPQQPSAGFSAKGINTASPAYKRAYPGCLHTAIGVYQARLHGQL